MVRLGLAKHFTNSIKKLFSHIGNLEKDLIAERTVPKKSGCVFHISIRTTLLG